MKHRTLDNGLLPRTFQQPLQYHSLQGRESFLVMPMPESSMVKVELVLSGMISDARDEQAAGTGRIVEGIEPCP